MFNRKLFECKKVLKEKMKNMSLEDQIDMCFRLQQDKSAEMELRRAANSIFCSLVDVHSYLCGMANEALKNREV